LCSFHGLLMHVVSSVRGSLQRLIVGHRFVRVSPSKQLPEETAPFHSDVFIEPDEIFAQEEVDVVKAHLPRASNQFVLLSQGSYTPEQLSDNAFVRQPSWKVDVIKTLSTRASSQFVLLSQGSCTPGQLSDTAFFRHPTWKMFVVMGLALLATVVFLVALQSWVHSNDVGHLHHMTPLPRKEGNKSAVDALLPSSTQHPRPTAAPNPCMCCKCNATLHVPKSVLSTCGEEQRPCFVEHTPYNHWFLRGPFVEPCWSDDVATSMARVDKCLTPDRGRDGKGRAMFLIGDSHAAMFVTALREAVGKSYSLSFQALGKSECFRLKTSYQSYCTALLEAIKKNLRSGDVLLLSFAIWQFSPYKVGMDSGSLENVHEYACVLNKWHRLVSARNATMIMLGDPTPSKQPGLSCVPTASSPNAGSLCARPVEWSDLYGRHLREQLHILEQAWHDVHFFDPRALFCTEQACGAMVPGTHTLAIGDYEHLTIEGSYYIWPFLCSFLQDKGILR